MKFIKSLKNTQWSGVLSLGIGTIVAQSINVLIQPVLTRLLTPEELGIYTFIISMAALIIPVASLKLEMLIVIDKDNDNAENLTDTSIFLVLIISIAYAFFIVVMLLVGSNSFSDIGWYSLIIPFIVFSNGLRFIFISHNNRNKKYNLISKVNIFRELTMGIIQITMGFISGGVFGQTLGYGLAPLVGLKLQTKDYMKAWKNRRILSYKKLKSSVCINKNHILYLVPSQFINSFSSVLITFSVISLFQLLKEVIILCQFVFLDCR